MDYQHIRSWADLKRSMKPPEPELPFWKKILAAIAIGIGVWIFAAFMFSLQ